MTPATQAALAAATDLVGYGPYLDRVPRARRPVPPRLRQPRRARSRAASRCRSPPQAARSPSYRAAIPACSPWRRRCSRRSRRAIRRGATLDIRVEPGVTAMLAAAAEVGAPLGGDFCAISLSDNLKPWAIDRAPPDGCRRGRLRDRALQSGLEGAAASARRGVRRCCARSRPARRRCCSCAPPARAEAKVDRDDAGATPMPARPTCARWSSSAPARRGHGRPLGLHAAQRAGDVVIEPGHRCLGVGHDVAGRLVRAARS